jgi:hypothetical protein
LHGLGYRLEPPFAVACLAVESADGRSRVLAGNSSDRPAAAGFTVLRRRTGLGGTGLRSIGAPRLLLLLLLLFLLLLLLP